MSHISEAMYQRIKAIVSEWSKPDIYAISFFVDSNEAYEYNGFSNISTFAIGYNTERDCEGAGPYDEERWNYAFWRHEEIPVIDPDEPDSLIELLFQWYQEHDIVNIGYEDTENCYDSECNYIGKGPVGHYELIGLITEVAKRLQAEGFFEKQLRRKIPIIIHGLEYAWYEIEATVNANPNGEADAFLKAMQELGMI